MVRSNVKFTYEDYKNLPEDDPNRYELLEGELVVVPSPGESHQSISGNLFFLLYQFVKNNDLGKLYAAPFDVLLGDNVVQPDTMFISKDRIGIVTKENVRGAPDIVVEILSPATSAKDRGIKRRIYARYGVAELWTVDPDKQTIEVAKLGKTGFETTGVYKKGETLVSSTLPGLKLKLDEVFQATGNLDLPN